MRVNSKNVIQAYNSQKNSQSTDANKEKFQRQAEKTRDTLNGSSARSFEDVLHQVVSAKIH